MLQVPLVTSVPPSLSRVSARGEELGPDWLDRCRASWHAAGFVPISVNSAQELQRFGKGFTGVRTIVRTRDARAETGKPLVHFHDLLQAAVEAAGDGPVALANADVLLEGRELTPLVVALRPGQAYFSRRIDVPAPDSREGQPYAYGIDFFAMHARDLAALRDGGFVFGAPWWDYYLPAALLAARVVLRPLAGRHVFHLAHGERWNAEQWRLFGGRFVERVPPLLREAGSIDARGYLRELLYALGRRGLVSRGESALARLAVGAVPGLALRIERRTLNRVSNATNRFLDKLAPA
jgi:hypothetical protein